MKRSTRFKVLWTVWLAGGGLVTTVVVYAITASVGWALIGLLASGVVLNAVGQVVADGHRSDGVGHLGPNDGGDRPDPGPDLNGVPPVSGLVLRHGTGREAFGIRR